MRGLSLLLTVGFTIGTVTVGALSSLPLELEREGGAPYASHRDLITMPGRSPVGYNGSYLYRHDHVWDVRRQVTSVLRPEHTVLDLGRATLKGDLYITVPRGCADRAVKWYLDIDGEQTRQGRIRWVQKYVIPTTFSLAATPRTITLHAEWNGGTSSCPSFGLVWDSPEITRKPFGL